MAKVKFTKTFLNSLTPSNKRVDYSDSEVKGLILRVMPSGVKTWRLNYRNAEKIQKRYTIGSYESLTLTQARNEAMRLNGLIAQGVDVQSDKQEVTEARKTFKQYLDDFYVDWYMRNRKSYQSTLNILQRTLEPLHTFPLEQIDAKQVDIFLKKYQQDRGCSNSRINRILVALKGSISRAVEFGYLKENPLSKLKQLKESSQNIRYLTNNETEVFFETLEKQPKILRDVVIVAYYSGMRLGEILSLKWSNIDYHTQQIILDAEDTKTNKGRSIPLHKEIVTVISNIKNNSRYIFVSEITGEKLNTVRSYWDRFIKESGIDKFRFHDLRHNFCSMLVMKGVPIYTVAQLAGHSDVKTTQRYAHLSPDVKKSAIDLI
ncbi:phage integrase family protein [Francisella philomiragia]|uniref:tyrosine-type recombinase/integrase n=1 Tax=Francisella philomiragia TaxID=28110 RepID=UPI0005A56900|nr:tyrosine-type recombinase/integrase [Francisella philomiragia]AJI57379.1 phage integrase family protein [Francisella philomiragia]